MVPVISRMEAAGWSREAGRPIPGCTQYPLALSALRQVFGADVDSWTAPRWWPRRWPQIDGGRFAGLPGVEPRRSTGSPSATIAFLRRLARFLRFGIRLERDPLWD